ncbi:hypothetical protein ACIPC1_20300 [Streptomyces sp. NPDC087263]|uniref:hypothetical protein n=1 Tax=Streptomyces sp. NPDC087263 TaxID=3365773 RepID=UPI003816B7D7
MKQFQQGVEQEVRCEPFGQNLSEAFPLDPRPGIGQQKVTACLLTAVDHVQQDAQRQGTAHGAARDPALDLHSLAHGSVRVHHGEIDLVHRGVAGRRALHPDAGNLRIVDHRNQPLQGAQVLVVKPPRRATSPVHARVSLPRSARLGGLAARAMISPQG